MQISSKKDIIEILKDDSINEELFSYADSVRKKYVGDKIHLRGLIEFSNYCKNTCKYCGLRCENKNIERYRILEDEILEHAKNASNLGFKTIVLQSGEDNYYTVNRMCNIISEIKKLNVALTLSIGEKTFEEYKAYKDAGADRYLIRIETTDENLYSKMHPGMSLENRKRCLRDLKTLGYEVGSGCLVGLPNQSIESLADDILFFKEIAADMIGVGPFIPHPDTPLKDASKGSFFLALKVMAITRILLKDINIPATTAMESIQKDGRIIALQSGANVVMPNVTTTEYRQKYEIYKGKACINENPTKCLGCITNKIKLIGRSVSKDFGSHKKVAKE
ncbi:MAG: [FeFe] hydrogenase H-cluster radical SAM maturase HydE [Bdellovibrionota bacterium]|nr:[FeFe] hydrogenase H-cluster radical SAM maturase HydE [Pseudomonadota bacterium]MDY6090631.1 [FeFe] hydrogenase H-cluster radical SAM maturase HydE [Bdellovibrionota bacterium]